MSSSDRHNSTQKKGVSLAILDGVLVYLTWSASNFCESHGYPFVRDVCYYLHFLSMLLLLFIVIFPIYPYRKTLAVFFVLAAMVLVSIVFPNGAPMLRHRFLLPSLLTLAAAVSWFSAVWSKPVKQPLPAQAENPATTPAPRFKIRSTTALILAGSDLSFKLDDNGNSPPRSPVGVQGGESPLLFYAVNGVVFVKATITDATQRTSIDGWDVFDLAPGWDLNQDNVAMEIVNAAGQPVFQLETLSDTTLRVAGCFVDQRGIYVIVGPDSYATSDNSTEAKKMLDSLRPIFKHPASEFSGRRMP